MPTIPWAPAEPVLADVVVMASRFRVRKLRHVLPFFIDAMRIYAQTRKAEGAVGVSLVAHPLRREFATLSAWRDEAALRQMVRTEPHRSMMAPARCDGRVGVPLLDRPRIGGADLGGGGTEARRLNPGLVIVVSQE